MNLILFEKGEVNLPLACSDARAKHLLNILKLQEGDHFCAGEIGGLWGSLKLKAISKTCLHFGDRVFNRQPSPLLPIHLIIGVPRPPTARRLLRDLTTLGAHDIVFSATKLTEKSYLQSSLWKEDARLALLEGAMQARTTLLPTVHLTERLSNALDLFETTRYAQTAKLYLEEDGKLFSKLNISQNTTSVALAIGPERGFTKKERQLLQERCWHPCHLSSRTLRTETACTVAFALAQTKWFSFSCLS